MKIQPSRISLILIAAVTLLTLSPSSNAATVAGAGIEVNGKYVGGYAITWDGETRENLVGQLSKRPITFERNYKIPVDAKDPNLAFLDGRIRILSRIRGDRQVMATPTRLKLVKHDGKWSVEPEALKRALETGQESESEGKEKPKPASKARAVSETPPTIHLFSEGKADEEGLKITLKKRDYQGVATEKVEFEILIVNRLLEEVFVEVTQLGEARITIRSDAGFMVTERSRVLPENIPLLKRLQATTDSNDGKRVTRASTLATVKQSAKLDLSEWVGHTGTLSFKASGFYRSSGKRFSETIDLKFNITDPSKSK